MSANDVFVLSSLMLGKLKSFTWLWPSWDVNGPRHKLLRDDEYIEGPLKDIANNGLFVVRAGSVRVANKRGESVEIGCSCMYFAESGKVVKCELGDEAYENELLERDDSIKRMYRNLEKRCQWRGAMPLQHVSDTEMATGSYVAAAELHKEPTGTALVLDIDEDFFGVLSQRDSKILMGSLPQEPLEEVARALRRLHVRSVAQEAAVNAALRSDLQAAWRRCWEGPRARPVCSGSRAASALSGESEALLARLLPGAAAAEQAAALGVALHALVRSEPNAAHLLNAYGFCLTTSPITYRDKSGGFAADGKQVVPKGMKMCAEAPNSHQAVHNDPSFVTRAASDSPFEIARRLALLARALRHERQRPALVTICRSIRDGYAYPQHWAQIEGGLLKMLEARYGPLDVRYDPNLLGGAEGWAHHAAPLE